LQIGQWPLQIANCKILMGKALEDSSGAFSLAYWAGQKKLSAKDIQTLKKSWKNRFITTST